MKTISLVIPVYNEEKRIDKILKALGKGLNFNGIIVEKVVFVDDGSRDETAKKIKNFIKDNKKNQTELISYIKNKGRGQAVVKGALRCDSDFVLYVDADLSIPFDNLKQFKPYIEKDYDLMFGSKKKPGAKQIVKRGKLRTLVGYGHSVIASMVLGVWVWDFQGGFKIFSRRLVEEIFPQMTVDRWGFDMEIIYLAEKLKYKTVELPVIWGHVDNGSKVKLVRDILRSLKDMFQIRKNWQTGVYRVGGWVKPEYA
jgi:dolichyl-phosphate beta-glucosyltransferase